MQLHHLTGKQHPKRRIGRGGKRGTTSGRGTKGQKSRSGRRIRPAAQDIILRIPKKRGFANKPTSPRPAVVNLVELLEQIKKTGTKVSVIDAATIKELGFLPKRFQGIVKILGDGDISQALTFKGVKVSASARTKIEKAGGKVE